MKKKFPSPSKNKRFRAHAIFAAAICLCMLLAACPPDDPGVNPTPQTAATPTATPAAGEVADNTAITLATATKGAKVYYTQDGTEPNKNSTLYSDSNKPAITTGKLTLKAIAVKDGMNNSATLTAVYTIATPAPPDFGSESTTVTLPAISLTSSGAAIDLSTGVTADNLAWSCTTYTPVTGVTTAYAPGEVTALINNADTKNASVTVKKAGTYIFELTASNTGSTAVTKTVTVVVNGYQETKTLTKDVNITLDSYTLPAASISLIPNYQAEWDSDFIESDYISNFTNTITYTFQGDGHTHVYTYPHTEITVEKQTALNVIDTGGATLGRPWPPALYKQTFSYNDTDVSYSVFIGDSTVSGGTINRIKLNDNATNPGVYNSGNTDVTSLPPVPLKFQLTKQVTETISEVE